MHLRRDIRKRSRRYRAGRGRGWPRIAIPQPGNGSSHHTDRDEAALWGSRELLDRRRRQRQRRGNGRKRKIEAGSNEPQEERSAAEGDRQGGGRRCERRLRFHVELQRRATDVPWHEPQDGDTPLKGNRDRKRGINLRVVLSASRSNFCLPGQWRAVNCSSRFGRGKKNVFCSKRGRVMKQRWENLSLRWQVNWEKSDVTAFPSERGLEKRYFYASAALIE